MLNNIKNRLVEIYKRKNTPDCQDYIKTLDLVNDVLVNENVDIRPYAGNDLPGGLVNLKKNIPTIIVPDLHARVDFFINIMFFNMPDGGMVIDRLGNDTLQVVCVGDGFHSEIRGFQRWKKAFEEFKTDYRKHENMDEEMKESLGVMEMVMNMKINFSDNFHFLKGNHENILNENRDGNYPFRKFAYEGPMVYEYVRKFYSDEFLSKYYTFEKNLPLFAIGRNFLISHAEPETFYKKEDIIEYKSNPDLIRGFTWTDNDQAGESSVSRMLRFYLGDDKYNEAFYFGGHRPIVNNYNARANGKYIQIHNPMKFLIAVIDGKRPIDIDRDIIELADNTRAIVEKYSVPRR